MGEWRISIRNYWAILLPMGLTKEVAAQSIEGICSTICGSIRRSCGHSVPETFKLTSRRPSTVRAGLLHPGENFDGESRFR